MHHHHTTLADLKIDEEAENGEERLENAWKLAKEKGNHHKPTSIARKVVSIEPKTHTER
jgi:hypothetical protein